MRFTITPFVALTALLAAACGGDSSGPGSNNAVPLTGSWSYSTSNLSAIGVTCNSSGTILTVTQVGSTFSGTYSGGTLSCTSSSGTVSGAVGSGVVVSGSLVGNAVSFDLDTSDWRNTGSVTGNSMSGTVTVRVVVSGTLYTLTGAFGAARL